jgi:hypothetical protein
MAAGSRVAPAEKAHEQNHELLKCRSLLPLIPTGPRQTPEIRGFVAHDTALVSHALGWAKHKVIDV